MIKFFKRFLAEQGMKPFSAICLIFIGLGLITEYTQPYGDNWMIAAITFVIWLGVYIATYYRRR